MQRTGAGVMRPRAVLSTNTFADAPEDAGKWPTAC
jgi:hypothetical protein